MWAKFTPDDIYYVGGFGEYVEASSSSSKRWKGAIQRSSKLMMSHSTHYIGHVPVDVYTAAGEEEAKESAEQNMVLQS